MPPPRAAAPTLAVCLVTAFCGCLAVALCGCGEQPWQPNLLLVTLDTTRPDHLGCYGYAKPTSPQLDRLAADAVVFERAYSTSSWTLPAHASLFTGRFPGSHGAHFDAEGPLRLSQAVPDVDVDFRARGLGPELQTLAQLLTPRGFRSAAVVGGPWMKAVFGLDRGFGHYDDRDADSVPGRLAADVTDAALAWLDANGGERFFMFLNYYDPHSPYDDPAGYAEKFLPRGVKWKRGNRRVTPAILRALYDGEIRYTDDQLGRLLTVLRQRGLYDDTWIVVTADHGELLGEHAELGHGGTLYEEEIRVPLIVKHPARWRRSGRDDTPIQLTDVFGLLLEGYGIPLPSGVRRPGAETPLFAEVYPPALPLQPSNHWRVLLEGGLKLHWSSRGRHRLFDLAADPAEARDLAAERAARVAEMSRDLEGFVAALPPPPARGAERSIDPQTGRALRELGYLE
jgi:choline-sulfatase